MASQVTSAPPELKVPVTMCSVTPFPLATQKGIIWLSSFLKDHPSLFSPAFQAHRRVPRKSVP